MLGKLVQQLTRDGSRSARIGSMDTFIISRDRLWRLMVATPGCECGTGLCFVTRNCGVCDQCAKYLLPRWGAELHYSCCGTGGYPCQHVGNPPFQVCHHEKVFTLERSSKSIRTAYVVLEHGPSIGITTVLFSIAAVQGPSP